MAVQLNHLSTLNSNKHEKQPKPPLPSTRRRTALQLQAVYSSNGRQLIQSGAVRAVQPKDAATAIESEGFKLLDIRPAWEREKARVKGSLHVPLFVEDKDNSPVTLLKKWVHFGYIGLWTGQYFTTLNPDFLLEVEKAVPDKDSKLLVACGEGLRSMMAATRLFGGGYKNLGWLAGGFNRAVDDDFSGVEGTEKLQYATIGGASYYFLQLLIFLEAVGKSN
ncbi:rhodanese-like domain-containing protein 10 [Alnus glutinosa]|uniref:rhodanese-like domain-containing protein 10 n=1 Tax=Alnus glutinosa TaxID=3517 RepID=UPI002D79F8F0|nr:rhodanese-like domain-containing protein 10 [Alnus glutinosa]